MHSQKKRNLHYVFSLFAANFRETEMLKPHILLNIPRHLSRLLSDIDYLCFQSKSMINFDEYIRQGEPQKREKGYAWQTAIGLQAVDGLKPSEYLIEPARRNYNRRSRATHKELLPVERSTYSRRCGNAWSRYGIDQYSSASYRKDLRFYACRTDIDSSSDIRRCIQVCRANPRL